MIYSIKELEAEEANNDDYKTQQQFAADLFNKIKLRKDKISNKTTYRTKVRIKSNGYELNIIKRMPS